MNFWILPEPVSGKPSTCTQTAGVFLRRHVCAAMGMQRVPVERPRAADERADDLPPFRVRQADNGDLGHARVFQQAVLNLRREMVLATPDDHLLDATSDGDVAARIHPAQIAGVQPTHRVDGLGRGLGVVVVFQHDAGAAGTDFPDLSDGDNAIVIDTADRDLGLRKPAGQPCCRCHQYCLTNGVA